MWLLTAVGAVNAQNHFTFALEQNRSYSIGRDKSCDIRFESKSVRLKEGILSVGDYDPTNRQTPPVITFKVEAKKNGAFPSYRMMTPYDNAVGSMNRDEYVMDELAQQGLYFENPGQGVELGGDSWFFAQWIEMYILYRGLDDTQRAGMKRYCIPWMEAFAEDDPPTIVLAPQYKSASDLNLAVCYGIRIVTPAYLDALLASADASWKKVVDSQDSFQLPDEASPAFLPTLSPGMANVRNDVAAWLPDPERRTLFAGYKILGLKGSPSRPPERRYLEAMGAEWSDIDIVSTPLLSETDFSNRIAKWVAEVAENGDRRRAIMAHFSGVKEAVNKAGTNWNRVVAATCQGHGFWLTSGYVCWASVKFGSVQRYLAEGSGTAPTAAAPAETASSAADRRSPEKTRQATQTHRDVAVLPDPTPALPRIPSTYPDETAALAHPTAEAGPSTRTRHAVKEKSLEPEPPAPTAASGIRKPLKRRAGKQTTQNLFSMDIDPPPSEDTTPPDSLGDAPKEDSIPLPSAAQRTSDTQTTNIQLSQTNPLKPSRLKRRAGGATQASTFDLFADAVPTSIKDEETPQEIRDLYEATRRGDLPTLKRTRMISGESAMTVDEDSQGSDALPASLPPQPAGRVRMIPTAQADAGDVDMDDAGGEDEDFVQKTLRKAAASRKAGRTQTTQAEPKSTRRTNMPPPSLPLRRGRSPTEEPEVIETKRPRLASPDKPKKDFKAKPADLDPEQANEPTTDPAFLLAVSKSRSKKAIDEMDKEFNNLKIPKSAIKGKQAPPQPQDIENMDLPPDYGILNDFGDEMRGNFIQVIRKDLYRKDGGAREVTRVEDGRPNYKKFKKKEMIRREPLPLVLVGRNTEEEEMGEPYWPEATGRKGQMSLQSQTLHGENEDSLPLMPRARNRKLLPADADDDEPVPLSLASTNRRRGAAATDSQSGPSSSTLQPRATQRKTRGTSVISEADSTVSTSTRATRSTRTSAVPAKGRKALLLPEDSDEEEEGVKFTPSNSGGRTGATATKGSRSTAAASASTGGRWRTAPQDEPPPPTASVAPSASSRQGRSTGPASSSVTIGRRKLMPVDEDDDAGLVFKAAAKKRRVG